jgi:hypothetical protein
MKLGISRDSSFRSHGFTKTGLRSESSMQSFKPITGGRLQKRSRACLRVIEIAFCNHTFFVPVWSITAGLFVFIRMIPWARWSFGLSLVATTSLFGIFDIITIIQDTCLAPLVGNPLGLPLLLSELL